MVTRALLLVAVVAAIAGVPTFTASAAVTANAVATRPSPPAPRTRAKALKILHDNVRKFARDFKRAHYRAVCANMTRKELKHLGGTSQCMFEIELIDALAPIRKFTITSVKLNKARRQAAVSLYVNGIKKHRIHAVVKWEGGAYRLDQQSGWKPAL